MTREQLEAEVQSLRAEVISLDERLTQALATLKARKISPQDSDVLRAELKRQEEERVRLIKENRPELTQRTALEIRHRETEKQKEWYGRKDVARRSNEPFYETYPEYTVPVPYSREFLYLPRDNDY